MQSSRLIFICLSIIIVCSIVYFSYSPVSDSITFQKNPHDSSKIEETKDSDILAARNSHKSPVLPKSIDVLIVFTKVSDQNTMTIDRFRLTVIYMLNLSSIPVTLHVVSDNTTRVIVDRILDDHSSKFHLIHHDMDRLSKEINRRLNPEMMQYFRHSPDAYYGDPLFFLSLVLADVFPQLDRLIKIDSDLWFRSDVVDLWSYFDRFTNDQQFGFALEQQPVYRHVFNNYRSNVAGTQIGDPPPDGLTGFNSGVILLDLQKIRSDKSPFRKLIRLNNIKRLVDKYRFRGHLGDQDVYTLVGIENPELFYVFPCQWNRQLSEWWRDHGYADVFDQYWKCPGAIKIYHGNGQSPFPNENDVVL